MNEWSLKLCGQGGSWSPCPWAWHSGAMTHMLGLEQTNELWTNYRHEFCIRMSMIYLSTVHLSLHNISHHFSVSMHSVLSATLTAREMGLYTENIPFKFIKHTHTQIWGKGKRSLKENRNVRVGKSQCVKVKDTNNNNNNKNSNTIYFISTVCQAQC